MSNIVDRAQYKHVPAAIREASKLIVNVGSTAHPMPEEHHAAGIAVASER